MSLTDDAPADVAETGEAPITAHQQFLCLFDAGDPADGPFGPRYHIAGAWRIGGGVDADLLRAALGDLVVRHEALRTVIDRGGEVPVQRVLAPAAPRFDVRELDPNGDRDLQSERLYNEVEAGTVEADQVPLLYAVLGRFDEQDAVLVLNVHHTAADGWSMYVIMRDLMALYSVRAGFPSAAPPPAPQYRDFAAWEAERLPTMDRARQFWRENLDGAAISVLKTEMPRSAGLKKATAWHRFDVPDTTAELTREYAAATRSSVFMILLAAYNEYLRRETGQTDLTVPTFALGRNERFMDTVGAFVNFLPIRTDIGGAATFREIVERTRRSSLRAFANELPFAEVVAQAPAVMAPMAADDVQTWAFQAAVAPGEAVLTTEAGLSYTKVWRRTLDQPVGTDVPDGALWTLHVDQSGAMAGSFGWNSNRNTTGRMTAVVPVYLGLLGALVAEPDLPLSEI
jgi:condensation enzyme